MKIYRAKEERTNKTSFLYFMWTHSCFLFCSCNNYCTSHSDRVNKSIWDLMQQRGRLIQYSIICNGGGRGAARKRAKSSKSTTRHITIILPYTHLFDVCVYVCMCASWTNAGGKFSACAASPKSLQYPKSLWCPRWSQDPVVQPGSAPTLI